MLLSKQSQLPRLPVPSLDATLTKLVRTLEPLGDAADVARVAALADDFKRTVGPRLQQLLVERDRTEPNSWLETWWNELAYLRYRECVPINVSFAMPFLVTPAQLVDAPVRRAALLCHALLQYKQLIDTGALPMDPQPSDQLPHTRIFGACRVPKPECDTQVRYPAAASNHFVVVWRDAFWLVDGTLASGEVAPPALLEAALRAVQSSALGEAPPRVGALTYAHRDAWADAHAELLRDGNAAALEALQSAAFVVCLDPARPDTLDAHAAAVLHADPVTCSNRWFDKPVQLIVFANGRAGVCGEHSPVDGEPVARLADWVCGRELELLATPPPSAPAAAAAALRVERLRWALSARSMQNVRDAVAFAARQIAGVRVHQLEFGDYGKDTITKLGVSPDAWAQAAMQLGYYRRHGRFAPTYESASTRRHLAGRTETGRTLTPELARFVRAMQSGGGDPAHAQALLVAATKAHVAYMREAGAGHGVDRHLLAMRLLAAQSGVSHPLFSDPLVAASTHWRLSTSQLAVKHVCIGFGPVVPDGYGVCYQIHKGRLHFSISSFVNEHGTDAFALADYIQGALRDMLKLFPAQPAAL